MAPVTANFPDNKAMQIVLEVPEDLARCFSSDVAGLSRVALEGLALEGIRSGTISKAQGRRLLGISSRYEMDGFLKRHGLEMELTIEDVRSDSDAISAFLK